jgi:hypothetical protein
MSPYVLFYSYACDFSKEIIETLKEHNIETIVDYYCIDGIDRSLIPSYVTHVPTLRIKTKSDQFVLVGKEITGWISEYLSKTKVPPRRRIVKEELVETQQKVEQQQLPGDLIPRKNLNTSFKESKELETPSEMVGTPEDQPFDSYIQDDGPGFDELFTGVPDTTATAAVSAGTDRPNQLSSRKDNESSFDDRLRAMEALRDSQLTTL